LVRKDYAPAQFVTWIYEDPQRVEKQLSLDKDFSRIYVNDLMSVYERNDSNSQKYGFQLTQDVVYALIYQNGTDYATISKKIGNISQPVILNSVSRPHTYQENGNNFHC